MPNILSIDKKKRFPERGFSFYILKEKDYFMSVRIKDAIILENVTSELKIPIGNAGNDTQALALTVGQIKDFTLTGLSTVATTGSYNNLTDKPDLNIYATVSTLNSNYYNKTEIDALITGGEGGDFLKMKFLDKLPEKGEANTFYFVKSEFPQEQNSYNEYVWDEKSKSYEIVSKSNYITEKDLPPVYDSQITIKQGSVTKGTFTLNQSGNATINLDGNEDFVTVSTDQTITGTKTFNKQISIDTNDYDVRFLAKFNNLTLGTLPTSNVLVGFRSCDSLNKEFANINCSYNTQGRISSNFYVNNQNGVVGRLGIYIDKDGSEAYTIAPTPATSDNSTKIATTEFVKAQGYVSSANTKSLLVTYDDGTQETIKVYTA